MAFSTRRGRPRSTPQQTDVGTPELRLKHALGLTAEPIDLCLTRALITPEQHWCGLHLRWLYTLRYGAPVLTTRYADREGQALAPQQAEEWRALREQEYEAAVTKLTRAHRCEYVMRLCVFNELPAFLSPALRKRACTEAAMAQQLAQRHQTLIEGLDILVQHWRSNKTPHHQKA